MTRFALSLALLMTAAGIACMPAGMSDAQPSPRPPGDLRCGWYDNPTPGNHWLTDRDGEWTLGEQGGYQVPGLDDLGNMARGGKVYTNGSYGYSCACMRVDVDWQTRRVTRVYSARSIPLSRCRNDRALSR